MHAAAGAAAFAATGATAGACTEPFFKVVVDVVSSHSSIVGKGRPVLVVHGGSGVGVVGMVVGAESHKGLEGGQKLLQTKLISNINEERYDLSNINEEK